MIRLSSWLAAIGLAVALLLQAGVGQAHETTRSYVNLTRDGTAVSADFRVAFRDIEVAVWIDEDLDGAITWGEVQRRIDPVSAYVLAGFALQAGGACVLTRDSVDTSESGGVAYLDIGFTGVCPDAAAPLEARSHLFTEIDPDHRMFLSAQIGGSVTTELISAAHPDVVITGDTGGLLASFAAYFVAGVEHLLGGADHMVFLAVLILPAVCARGNLRQAALGVMAAVTGFTLAHALTVTAAMTEILRPPPAVIESLIALSILLTAIDNLRPFLPVPRAAAAAFFGIFHGFGFASALGALQLTGGGFVAALVGFNVGIEVAQVVLVLVTMPVLYLLGAGRAVLWIGSAAAGAAGLWWLGVRLTPLLLGAA